MENKQLMLIDFCINRVATVGGDGYSETVLYQNEDGSCEVHHYRKYETDLEEKETVYSVNSEVIQAAYKIIEDNKVDSWNQFRTLSGLCGAVYVLKYRKENGEYVRVSSDCMPENGVEVMRAVNDCMNSYIGK